MIAQIDIDCTAEELAMLLAELPDPAQRYEILRRAIKPKPEPKTTPRRVTLRPELPQTETVAIINLTGTLLTAKLTEKLDAFRQVVKFQCHMDFDWDGRQWFRRLSKFSGEPIHRVTELCHRLLAENFVIEVDADWVDAIHVADYLPEQTKWIKRVVDGGKYNDWFSVVWGKYDDYYEVAKRIRGSHYHEHQIVVPPVQFEAVMDFATAYDFAISDGAHELIAIAKTKRDAAILTTVEKPKPRKRVVAQDVRPKLEPVAGEGIDDEFADDIT